MSTLGKLWALLALTAVAGSLAAAPASAGQPCWQTVINDWADNERVDGRYAIHCYRDALKNLPEDMRAYSSAPGDIERAMREEMRRLQQQGSEASEDDARAGPATTTTAATGGGSSGSPEPAKPPAEREDEPLPYFGDPDADDQRAESDGVLVQALDEIGPNDASSFPLPLLVLGGLFALLMVAGGVGYLARRRHAPPSGRSGVNAPR